MSALRNVRLLHDNTPLHTSDLVKQFMKSEKVSLATPNILSRSRHMVELFPFPKLKSSYRVFDNQSLPQRFTKSAYRDALRYEFRDWTHVFQTVRDTLNKSNVDLTIWIENLVCLGVFSPDLVQNTEHIEKPWYQNILIGRTVSLSHLDVYCSYIIKIPKLDINRHVFILFLWYAVWQVHNNSYPPPPSPRKVLYSLLKCCFLLVLLF